VDIVLSQRKVQRAENMLRAAFIEFYRGLGFLKNYSSLNMVACAKILKKYDKVVHFISNLMLKE
jgi:SPX domain protein involved in polyphosphate accumulation